MENKQTLTVAICSFNRAERLKPLVDSLRQQHCSLPFDILIVDNNSTDNTQNTLKELSKEPEVPLRFVKENKQGISYARNRAIGECLDKDFMFFMDDDELPKPGILNAAVDALSHENADCAGGKVQNIFRAGQRPSWLEDELLGFFAEINHGEIAFWITDESTPIWTSNVAYNMDIFRQNPELRFDTRYNREGKGVGGGEDVIMFRELLKRKMKIRYRPDMIVEHRVEDWRLKRRYFLKLHYASGLKEGRYEMKAYDRSIFGIPFFLFPQTLKQIIKACNLAILNKTGSVRQAMNTTHAIGLIIGCFLRWKTSQT